MKLKLAKSQRYPAVLPFLRQFDPAACEELKFHVTRRWRFDFACPTKMVAIEIDGGVFTGGRHSGGVGQVADMEKGNEAVLSGWKVFHFTPQQIKTAYFVETMKRALNM
jgi:very-short-patch-repair endonuclease